MYYSRQVAAAVTFLSLLSAPAHAMFANLNSDLSAISGNRIQEQTYLDNYTSDFGTGPLASVRSNSTYAISDLYNAKTFLALDVAYYDKLNTYVGGLGVVSRAMSQSGLLQTFHLSIDYTNYDELDFYQAALGVGVKAHDYDLSVNGYIPFGDEQTYGGIYSSTLTGTNGADLRLSKSFDQLTLSLEGDYFWGRGIKDSMSSGAVGAAYDFNKMLTIGGSYGFLNGLDSSNTGYRGYIMIPLFRGHTSHDALAISNLPVKRQIGATVQAKETLTCTAGSSFYAYHGNSYCSTTNPFDGLLMNRKPKAAASISGIKSGVDLTDSSQSYLDFSDQTLTFPENSFHIINHVIKAKSIVVKPGATLLFTPKGHIIAQHTGTEIGESGTKNRVSLLNGGVFARELMNTLSSSSANMTGINGILRKLGVANPTTAEQPLSGSNNGYFITLTGMSSMDFAADDDTPLETNASNPLLGDGLVSKKASAAGERDSTLVTSAGPLASSIIGGGQDITTSGSAITTYAKINNVNFLNGGIMSLGANLSIEGANFVGGSDQHIYQVGGAVETKTVGFTSGLQNNGLVKLRGGAQFTAVGSLFDMTSSKGSDLKGIQMYDKHLTIGSDDTARKKLPQISVLQSLFKMGVNTTDTSTQASKDAIYIDSALNGSANGGLSLVLVNNVVNMPAIGTTALTNESNVRFANLPSTSATQFGTDGNATTQMNGTMLVAGHNLVPSIAADSQTDALASAALTYGLGFGNAATKGATGGNFAWGNNNTFPFALENSGQKSTGYLTAPLVTTDLAAPANVDAYDTDAELISVLAKFVNAGSDASPASVTYPTSVNSAYKSHTLNTPSTLTNRQVVAHNALTSRFGTTPVSLLAADDGTASNDVFRTPVSGSKNTFSTGNATVNAEEMKLYVLQLASFNTVGNRSKLTKIHTNAS